MINCPKCNSTSCLMAEDDTVYYQIQAEKPDQLVCIPYSIIDGNKTKNQRLYCEECKHEFPIPENKKVVFH